MSKTPRQRRREASVALPVDYRRLLPLPAGGPAPLVRAILAAPQLGVGSPAQWIAALTEHAPRELAITAVATADERPAAVAPSILARLSARRVPVIPASLIAEAASEADVVVGCGALAIAPGDCPAVRVFCSRGEGSDLYQHAIRESQFFRGATHRAAVSQAAGAWLPPPVAVLYNGASPERIAPPADLAAVRRRLRLGSRLAAAHIGRLTEAKGALLLAAAAAAGGFQPVYAAPGRSSRLVAEQVLDLAPDAVLVEQTPHIGDVLHAVDCVVLASQSEGHAMALCEAWLAGRPTVATPVGATPELEQAHGPLTVSVPVNCEPRQLAAAIRLAASEANRPVVDLAQRAAKWGYTAAAMARRWAEYLISVTTTQAT